jgi:protein O-mannosyl-transferase
VILVYWMANLILQHRLRALIAGLLFACHPALSEAVNCISFNDDLLATFFFLSSFIFYIRIKTGETASPIRGYFPALLCYFFGLLSKEMAITLPAIILLYDQVLRDRKQGAIRFEQVLKKLKERAFLYAGFIGVSLVYLCLRFFIFFNPRESLKASAGSLLERIIYLPGHIYSFIRLTIFPANLNADYVFAYPESWFESSNLIGFAVVMTLVGAAFFIYRYSKVIFFGLGWFLITLFPVYNLIEIYNPFAERYLYLPIIGFCLGAAALINELAMRRFTNPATATVVTLIPVIVVLSLYASVTMVRNRDWQNNFVLWSKTVQSSPDSLTARGGLGMAYLARGQLDDAAQQFQTAIKLNPADHKSYYNLGLVYHKKGDLKTALEYFNRSLRLNPESVKAHYNLATIYLQQRLWDLAIRHYVKVNELNPEIAMAHYNLGMAYAMQGKLNPAVSAWQKALQLDPHNTMAKNNIQKAKKMMNRTGGKVPSDKGD